MIGEGHDDPLLARHHVTPLSYMWPGFAVMIFDELPAACACFRASLEG